MDLFITPDGNLQCLYGEALDLAALGPLHVERASAVEWRHGGWTSAIAGGPTLGPFPTRPQALAAESAWLTQHLTELHQCPRTPTAAAPSRSAAPPTPSASPAAPSAGAS